MTNSDTRGIEKKLDEIIKLLKFSVTLDCKQLDCTQKEKILLLASLELAPKNIAEILGTTPNTVRVTLSQSRKESQQETQE